ncbi:GGDEF domain-containing protein [Vibrio sp. HDW18]|uniref:GGDEF domain-containing protein n=1 Tax=Vibrio sp. HDW18 TaxID=2714948 RepID=UPI00140C9649|nr:GGDEF domain-containing protein [Vibrio sp. HDW18]QIL86432.1 GGDEF domain-containing protein [Vibrio sp. HDW18]
MNARLFDNTQTLRASVLCSLSFCWALIALSMALFNFWSFAQIELALLEMLCALYSFYIYSQTKRQIHTARQVGIYLLLLTVTTLFATYIKPLAMGVYVWSCFVPILFYIFTSARFAFLTCSVFFLLQITIVYWQLRMEPLINWPVLLHLTFAYVGLWVVAHIYEKNRRKIEDSLLYLASRDALTGAHNRLSLATSFQHFEQVSQDTSLYLLVIDLDFFKAINDQHGHDTGDKVLVETTDLLTQMVGDHNLYRIGGEEFCVTLFDQSLEQAERICERLRTMISQHSFTAGDVPIQVTISIGVCQYHLGDKLNDLLKLADIELYRAKQAGRNQVRLCQHVKGKATMSCPRQADIAH